MIADCTQNEDEKYTRSYQLTSLKRSEGDSTGIAGAFERGILVY